MVWDETVVVTLNAVGAAQQLKTKKYKLPATASMAFLAQYIKTKLKMAQADSIVCTSPPSCTPVPPQRKHSTSSQAGLLW